MQVFLSRKDKSLLQEFNLISQDFYLGIFSYLDNVSSFWKFHCFKRNSLFLKDKYLAESLSKFQAQMLESFKTKDNPMRTVDN